MAESNVCPFCGSEKLQTETPYVDKFGVKITRPCCLAQGKNQVYIEKHQSRQTGEKSSLEEVSTW